jgi:hypothetical protein
MENVSDDKLHTLQDVARILRCSRWMIYDRARKGELEIIKLGPQSSRVTDRSLQAFIAGRDKFKGGSK